MRNFRLNKFSKIETTFSLEGSGIVLNFILSTSTGHHVYGHLCLLLFHREATLPSTFYFPLVLWSPLHKGGIFLGYVRKIYEARRIFCEGRRKSYVGRRRGDMRKRASACIAEFSAREEEGHSREEKNEQRRSRHQNERKG